MFSSRKINKDSNSRRKSVPKSREGKTAYGDEVYLTEDEYMKLVREYGQDGANKMIEMLDNYKCSSGKKYVSDYRAILSWVVDRYMNSNKKGKSIVERWRDK